MICRNGSHKHVLKLVASEFSSVNYLKEHVAAELDLDRHLDLRIYTQTGQEIIDDEDLPADGFIFYTTKSIRGFL